MACGGWCQRAHPLRAGRCIALGIWAADVVNRSNEAIAKIDRAFSYTTRTARPQVVMQLLR